MNSFQAKLCRGLCAFALCLLTLPALAAEPIAARLPADSCLALWSDDFAALANAFQNTSLGALVTGADFAPLRTELAARDTAAPMYLRPWFGFDWSDIAPTRGAGALAVFPVGDKTLGAAWLLDAAQSPDVKTACLAQGERYFLAKKFKRNVEKLPAGELIVYESPAMAKEHVARVHFTSGTFFGAANSRAAAEKLLAVVAGKALSQQAQFKSIATELKPGGVGMFACPWELWTLARSDKPGAKAKLRDPYVMARRQGIQGLQAIGGVAQFQPDEEIEIDCALALLTKSPYEKAFGLLNLVPGAEAPLAPTISAGTTRIVTWQWDFAKAMKSFGNLFDELNEPGPNGDGLFEDLVDGLRDDTEGPRVDLRKELFSQLGPQAFAVSDRGTKPTDKNPEGKRLLYRIAALEAPRIAAALKKFYAGDKQVMYEKFGDAHLWTVGDGASLFIQGENSSIIQPRAVAVTAKEVLFSSDIDFLKTAIEGLAPPKPLAKDSAWIALSRWRSLHEGKLTALRSFARLDSATEPTYAQIKAGKPTAEDNWEAALMRYAFFGTCERRDNQPIAALPAFERVGMHLHPAAAILTQSPTGWQARAAVLGPARKPTP